MGKFVDLSGRMFGRILVDSYAGKSMWNCTCDCGNKRIVNGWWLTSEKRPTQSCGCLKLELTKQYFEQLRQQEIGKVYNGCRFVGIWVEYGNAMVEALCHCGKYFKCRLISLTRTDNPQKSCGCLRTFAPGESSLNVFFRTYNNGAIKRDCFFGLIKEDFREIAIQNCHYCNCEP